jgi:hypothetical protein
LADIRVDEDLGRSTMLPEGIVETWWADDGSMLRVGDALVDIRIEGTLHRLTSHADGRLTIFTATNELVLPGALIGTVGR